jgi:nicotinamide phosphoribosyltransferase
MNPLMLTDGYKTGHHQQYPEGTRLVYSNFTPRSNKYAPKGCNEVVVFGTQMVMQQLHEKFESDFFKREKSEVCGEMKRELSMYLNTDYDVSHFEKLHDLGYLPIIVKGLPEGTRVPMRVPVLTIYNTHPDFYWLTNYLETILSNLLWKPMTSATIAYQYRKVLTAWMKKTDPANAWFVDWQGHDFSMRGMDSVEAVISSGVAHLTSFSGTDSLPAIHGARKYYGETEFVGGSVPATEHSVMCAGGKEDEVETFRRLLNVYPKGILSVVSDTWDLWKVCTEYVTILKEEILARDGKLVIRPDSGNPVDILCGSVQIVDYGDKVSTIEELKSWAKEELEEEVRDNTGHGECGDSSNVGYFRFEGKVYKISIEIEWNRYDKQYYFIECSEVTKCIEAEFTPDQIGVIELLWDVFGGTVNEQGYKVLDPHIGAIYGDSITIDRADEICKRLASKGFASTNVVLGIGSFTYQYNTRDTFGFAMKATYVELEVPTFGEFADQGLNTEIVGREIFKDPITDDGTKKSATGLLAVFQNENDGSYQLHDHCNWETEKRGELKTVYVNGQFENTTTLTQIRELLKCINS